jgi:hypothetical protein
LTEDPFSDRRTRSPGSHRPQQMEISCLNSSDFVPYVQNNLESGVNTATVSSQRQNNYQERSWP